MDFYLLVITATTYSSAVCQFTFPPSYFISPLSACFLSHLFVFCLLPGAWKNETEATVLQGLAWDGTSERIYWGTFTFKKINLNFHKFGGMGNLVWLLVTTYSRGEYGITTKYVPVYNKFSQESYPLVQNHEKRVGHIVLGKNI